MSLAEFWMTQEGILERAEMLSSRTVYSLYNEYIKAGARALQAEKLIYRVLGRNTCSECYSFADREYGLTMFLPYIPRHINCQCWWESYWPGVPSYIV